MRLVVELRVQREVVAVGLQQRLHFLQCDAKLRRQFVGGRDVLPFRHRRADGLLQAVHQIGALRRKAERASLL